MFALGIPTTRSLAVVATGEPVYLTLCAVGFAYSEQQPAPSPNECQPGGGEGANPSILGASVMFLSGHISRVPLAAPF